MRITIAYLFLQTLQFKFTAHPESVYLFSKLGIEPYGRIATGVAELIAALLILINNTKILGAVLSFLIICGALGAHFLILGIKVNGESVLLFLYALIIFCFSIILIFINKKEILIMLKRTNRKQ